MSGIEIVAATVIMAFGSLVQASVGFGLSLTAAPLLLLVDPLLVPTPLLVAALGLSSLVSIRDRQGIHARGVAPIMFGRVAGTVPGAMLIAVLPIDRTQLVLGLLILAAVGMSLVGVRVRHTRTALFGVGAVAGFMSAVAAVGGPPIALAYQHEDGKRLRGTMSFVLTFGTIISLVGLWFAGRLRMIELELAAWLIPGMLVGFLASKRTARILDRGYTRTAVLVLASGAAVVSVLSSLG